MSSFEQANPTGIIGCTAIKPVERHGFEAIRYFFHDPEHGTCMGRTPMSWIKIFVFYVIYYIFLACFWSTCLIVFLTTIDDNVPKYTQGGSLIGKSGALGVRPVQADKFIDSSMITYNQATEESGDVVSGWKEWAERADDFLQLYRNDEDGVDCSGGVEPGLGEFCKFDVSQLGPCGQANSTYGYSMGRPCVYLKLNKIYGLEPDYYNLANELPEDFPPRLVTVMSKLPPAQQEQVWVNCEAEHPADQEALGDIQYYPTASGFPAIFYPYLNQKNYLAPVVAVQFMNPTAGQLLHIECQALAGNIGYNRRDKIGSVRFELLIHNKATAEAVEAVKAAKGE